MSEYAYWRNALAGRLGPVVESLPQSGRYKWRRGDAWLPVAFWRDETGVWCRVSSNPAFDDSAEHARIWIACAKHPVTDEDYEHCVETGRWLTDPPDAVATYPTELAPHGSNASDSSELPGPGHNSGDPDSFDALRAALIEDIAEARAYYRRNPIKTKDDADRCENWRKRIYAAGRALDEKRKAEKKPHDDAIAAIQARYNPVLDEARACGAKDGELDALAQAWVRAEQARLRREAEERARAEYEAKVAAAEAERKRLEEERAAKLRDDPVAAMTEPTPALPEIPAGPVAVEAPKVMIGTSGNRRGAQSERHTATITDAKALAVHLAEAKHPDLMECLQRIANAAARSKARQTLPGCRMSWENGKAA